MLHYEGEVKAFLNAKKRIEILGESQGVPMKVGAFLYYFPKAISDENVALQIVNQRKYKLPIIHAQTPIYGENCLAYDSDDIRFGRKGLLEKTIEQCATLRDVSGQTESFDVNAHPGILVDDSPENLTIPCVYPIAEFLEKRDKLFKKSTERFTQLTEFARRYGLGTVLENSIPAFYARQFNDVAPKVHFLPFVDFPSIMQISGDNLTFDSAHWGSTRLAPEILERNQLINEREIVFKMHGISSWEEYLALHPDFPEYLEHTRALHLSNVDGIGVGLDYSSELARKWGKSGNNEGYIPISDFRKMINYTRERDVPVIIEVEYDVKNIPVNQFKEADDFLKHVL